MSTIRLLPPAKTFATGTLTLTGQPSDTQTFVVGATTYTMNTVLTDTANNILIGANATATCDNIVAAINAASGAGTTYGTGTTANAGARAVRSADTVVLTAKTEGPAGALIVTTESLSNATFGAATLITAGSSSVAAPTLTDATAGVSIGFCCDQAVILVRSLLGSGDITASPILWGYNPTAGAWFEIGALNSGNAIAETTTDAVNYAELIVGLRAFTRLHCELATGGTAPEFAIYAHCVAAEPVSR
jgi:hypothetical protein